VPPHIVKHNQRKYKNKKRQIITNANKLKNEVPKSMQTR